MPRLARSEFARIPHHITQCRNRRDPLFFTDEDRHVGSYLRAAIRYVERNPVRARMVRKAENYSWSSAQAHCGQRQDTVLTTKCGWRRQIEGIRDWSAWLAQGDEPVEPELLRRNVDKGLQCGSEKFIGKLERLTGRALQYRPRGRPRTDEDKG